MRSLTRDGTAEPVSRDQILRHEREQGNFHFSCSADHVQDWQPYMVDPSLAICVTIHMSVPTIGGGGYDNSVPEEVTKTIPSGNRATRSPAWSASLPRSQIISPGDWSHQSRGGASFVPSPPKTGINL